MMLDFCLALSLLLPALGALPLLRRQMEAEYRAAEQLYHERYLWKRNP